MKIFFATKNVSNKLDDSHIWGSISTTAGKVLDFCQSSNDNSGLVKGDVFYIVQAEIADEDVCQALTESILGGTSNYDIVVFESMKQMKLFVLPEKS